MDKKILIAYYSRTGTTKKLAETLAKELNCDLEEIKTARDRKGPLGYLISGREATLKKSAKILPAAKNPAEYDLLIIGTPIWTFNVSSPARAYLSQNKDRFKKVAFFCTQGGGGHERAFKEMAEICQQHPLATLALNSGTVISLGIIQKEILDKNGLAQINDFLEKIKKY
jgi:flavodoxin